MGIPNNNLFERGSRSANRFCFECRYQDNSPKKQNFVKFFATEVGPARASIMDAIHRPLIMNALKDPTGKPSWKTLPSWYMVPRKDQATQTDVEPMFAKRIGPSVVEIESFSCSLDLSSGWVTRLIVKAATSVK